MASAAESSRCDRHHRTIGQGVRTSAALEPQRIREEKAMSNNRQMIAAAHVEPAAVGFAIRTPNLFGPAHHYLVDEIQKAEIIAMMITRRPVLKRAVLVMVLVMWIMALASLVWLYGAGRDNPTPTDLMVMTVLTVAPMVTALYLALRHVMHPLRPGFSGATHASPQSAVA
jgi:uncharacterized membrane protein YdbT with pleckstrin-like domain